jgi:hypothetical protein
MQFWLQDYFFAAKIYFFYTVLADWILRGYEIIKKQRTPNPSKNQHQTPPQSQHHHQ